MAIKIPDTKTIMKSINSQFPAPVCRMDSTTPPKIVTIGNSMFRNIDIDTSIKTKYLVNKKFRFDTTSDYFHLSFNKNVKGIILNNSKTYRSESGKKIKLTEENVSINEAREIWAELINDGWIFDEQEISNVSGNKASSQSYAFSVKNSDGVGVDWDSNGKAIFTNNDGDKRSIDLFRLEDDIKDLRKDVKELREMINNINI